MQTVTTKYLPATNTRGARIKVSSWLGNKTFSYDHAASCAHEAAFNEWLECVNKTIPHDGFRLMAKGSLPGGKGYGFTVM